MSLLTLRKQRTPDAPGGFDPLTDIDWYNCWWAEDPNFTPPADGVAITSLPSSAGSDPFSLVAGRNFHSYWADSWPSMNGRPCQRYTGSQAAVDCLEATLPRTLGVGDWSTVTIQAHEGTQDFDGLSDKDGTSRLTSSTTGGNFRLYAQGGAGNAFNGTDGYTQSENFFCATVSIGNTAKIAVDQNPVQVGSITTPVDYPTVRLGARGGAAGAKMAGPTAFVGWYEGDITAHPRFEDLRQWWADTYKLGGGDFDPLDAKYGGAVRKFALWAGDSQFSGLSDGDTIGNTDTNGTEAAQLTPVAGSHGSGPQWRDASVPSPGFDGKPAITYGDGIQGYGSFGLTLSAESAQPVTAVVVYLNRNGQGGVGPFSTGTVTSGGRIQMADWGNGYRIYAGSSLHTGNESYPAPKMNVVTFLADGSSSKIWVDQDPTTATPVLQGNAGSWPDQVSLDIGSNLFGSVYYHGYFAGDQTSESWLSELVANLANDVGKVLTP